MSDIELTHSLHVEDQRHACSCSSALAAMQAKLDAIHSLLEYRERVLTGWTQIASHLQISESHARRVSDPVKYSDPIPVHRRGGVTLAIASELDSWQRRRERRRSVGESGRRRN